VQFDPSSAEPVTAAASPPQHLRNEASDLGVPVWTPRPHAPSGREARSAPTSPWTAVHVALPRGRADDGSDLGRDLWSDHSPADHPEPRHVGVARSEAAAARHRYDGHRDPHARRAPRLSLSPHPTRLNRDHRQVPSVGSRTGASGRPRPSSSFWWGRHRRYRRGSAVRTERNCEDGGARQRRTDHRHPNSFDGPRRGIGSTPSLYDTYGWGRAYVSSSTRFPESTDRRVRRRSNVPMLGCAERCG